MNHLFNQLWIYISLIAIGTLVSSFLNNEHLSDKDFVRRVSGYNALYKQEKAFIHTDKPIYFSGEDIWFSGFLLDAQTGLLNNTERVMYIELLKPNGATAYKAFYMLKNGRTKGNITLDENLDAGNYLLVAYTNWMRNTNTDFFFKKPLIILNENRNRLSLNTDTTTIEPLNLSEKTIKTTTPLPKLQLKFYPEGGDLVAGLASKVAFEATDENGANIKASGSVVDETGNVVASLNTIWKGRGYFTLMPISGKSYQAQITTTNGETFNYDLPAVKESGFGLKIETTPKSPEVLVTIANKSTKPSNKAFLLVMQNQKPIYAFSDTISNVPKTFSIPKHIFKSGIAQFTLFDEQKTPRCERLSLINKHEEISISVKNIPSNTNKRDKISLQLEAKDKNGQPVGGTFSLAITDAKRIPEESYSSPNFVNFLNFGSDLPKFNGAISELLESGMKGQIKSELVMLTSGWRRYRWSKVLQDKTELPLYKEEPGIYIKGQIYNNENRKRIPPEGLDITMLIPKKFEVYNQITDKSGEFSFLLKDFNGTSDAVLQTKTRMNMKKDYLIELQTNLKTSTKGKRSGDLTVETTENTSLYFTGEALDTSIYAEKGSLAKDLQRVIDFNFYLDTTDVTIDEVTVMADKARNAKAAIIDRYGPAQRSIGKKQITTLSEEKTWHTGIISLIEEAIPGLLVWHDPTLEEIRFIPKDRSRHRFFVFVDGQMVGASDDRGTLKRLLSLYEMNNLLGLEPELVEAIDLIYPPKEKTDPSAAHEATAQYSIDATNPIDTDPSAPTLLESGDDPIGDAMKEGPTVYTSPTAILSIYTKEGIGLNSRTHFKGLMNLKLTGFSKVKEFYQPNYTTQNEVITSDQRTTLFWEPEFNIDSTGIAEVSFYNSDIGHLFRVDAVGLSTTGVPGETRTTFGTETPLILPLDNTTDQLSQAIEVKYEPEWSSESKVKIKVLQPNGSAAENADIMVVDGSWGNVTNSEGICYIDKDKVAKNDVLIISYKGEARLEIKRDETLNGNKSIKLNPITSEVVDINADKLAAETLKSLLRNKPAKATYPNAVYRETVYWGDELHRLLDLSLMVRVPGIKEPYETYAMHPIAGQLYKTSAYDNKAKFSPQTNTMFNVHAMDAIFANLTVLDSDYLKYYTFKIEGKTIFQDRDVYKLSFDQKADAMYAMKKGYMLIDVETKGITYIEWQASDKGAKYIVQDSYILSRERYEDFKLKSDLNSTTYQLRNGKWEIKSGTQDVAFTINNRIYSYKREFLATGYATNQDFKFRPQAVGEMKNRFMLIKTPKYNLQNWREAWFVPSTENIRKNIPFMHEVLMLKGN